MATRKKLKLRRTERLVEDDDGTHMSVEEELMENVVKIKGVWQFRSTQKVSKRQKQAQLERIADEKAEEKARQLALRAGESDDETSYPEIDPDDLNAGETLVPARLHPDYENYVRLAMAGVDRYDLRVIMRKDGLDTGTLKRPDKPVVLGKKMVEATAKKQKETELEETPEEIAATERKLKAVTMRKVVRIKVETIESIQEKQVQLMRLADKLVEHYAKVSNFVGIEAFGDTGIGYSFQGVEDETMVKGITALLLDHAAKAEKKRKIYAARDEDELAALEFERERADDEEHGAKDFTNGSLVYKLERIASYMQYLGFLGMLDVPWTSGVRFFLVQGSFFLDSHMWPLVTVHQWIWAGGKVYKNDEHEKAESDAYERGYSTQPSDHRAGGAPAVGGGRGGGRGGRYLFGEFYLVDLYFYRDVTRYCYSLAFSAILLVAFFFLWQVDDYTDPKFTDKWRLMHIEHWWTLGMPRSLLYLVGYSIALVVIPAIVLEYTYGTSGSTSEYQAEDNGNGQEKGVDSGLDRSMKHSTTMLVSGFSLTIYVWLLYVVFTTMMRRVFISKTKHAKAYSSVVLLKNTLKWKATLLLVLIFLNYMPTCLYVLGGMVPVYSSKIWAATVERDPFYRRNTWRYPDNVPPVSDSACVEAASIWMTRCTPSRRHFVKMAWSSIPASCSSRGARDSPVFTNTGLRLQPRPRVLERAGFRDAAHRPQAEAAEPVPGPQRPTDPERLRVDGRRRSNALRAGQIQWLPPLPVLLPLLPAGDRIHPGKCAP